MIVVIKILAGFRLLGLLAVLCACFNAFSKDLGVLGKTYPIVEEDMLNYIQRSLKSNQQKIEEDQKFMKKRMGAYSENPTGVFLPRAKSYRATQITPIYTLDQNLTDSEGKILYKAGTKVNPLAYRPLTKALCFADGSDNEQIEWVVKKCGSEIKNKLILVSGNLSEISKRFKRRFFFDQHGFLSKKLDLQAIPAVVRQRGSGLYVEEFPL